VSYVECLCESRRVWGINGGISISNVSSDLRACALHFMRSKSLTDRIKYTARRGIVVVRQSSLQRDLSRSHNRLRMQTCKGPSPLTDEGEIAKPDTYLHQNTQGASASFVRVLVASRALIYGPSVSQTPDENEAGFLSLSQAGHD
jgi:hypothetical protein